MIVRKPRVFFLDGYHYTGPLVLVLVTKHSWLISSGSDADYMSSETLRTLII